MRRRVMWRWIGGLGVLMGLSCASPAPVADGWAALSGPPTPRPQAGARWDGATVPAELDRIRARFGLRAAEEATLRREGFVVLDRLGWTSYAHAYHVIHQLELPVYVSADSLLHALFKLYETTLESLERESMAPRLAAVIERMRGALPSWSAGVSPQLAADLDLYLAVAASLGSGEAPRLMLGGDPAEASRWVERLLAASGAVSGSIFGREREVDASAWKPRGSYAGDAARERYFRQAMWLSRLEFNVVTRDGQSSTRVLRQEETPREALAAFGLAELAEASGALEEAEALQEVWGSFAGRREDMGLRDLASARQRAGVKRLDEPDAFERLKGAIGGSYKRTTAIHLHPEGVVDQPVIATLLGPRITADTEAISSLAHDRTEGRYHLHAGDVGSLLGLPAGRRLAAEDVARWPALEARYAEGGEAIRRSAAEDGDLYAGWLGVVRSLGEAPEGHLPGFMQGAAWEEVRLNSALVGYSQVRHANVLLVGEPYGAAGCVIPDGWVEPSLATLDASLAWVGRLRQALERLGYAPEGLPPWQEETNTPEAGSAHAARGPALLGRFEATLRALRQIAAQEVAGQPLTAAQRRYLAMISELVPAGTDSAPEFNGWYMRLFESPQAALSDASQIASYYTSGETQEIAYLGGGGPRLGIFVVDSDGGPRAVVGPVAAGYEHHGPTSARLSDAEARALPAVSAPWRARWAVSQGEGPALRLEHQDGEVRVEGDAGGAKEVRVVAMGHHGEELQRLTLAIQGAGPWTGRMKLPERADPESGSSWPAEVEFMRVEVGDFTQWVEVGFGGSVYLELGPGADGGEGVEDE